MQFTSSVLPGALGAYGWNPQIAGRFGDLDYPHRQPVRIVRVDRDGCLVMAPSGMARCRVPGSLPEPPVTGDWAVACADPIAGLVLEDVLVRTTAVRRANAAGTGDQMLVANIDTMFVLHGLDRPHRVGRLERLSILTWDAGATPVIVLTKIDLADSGDTVIGLEEAVGEVRRVLPAVEVCPVSAVTGAGIELLSPYLTAGATVGLAGESGAGKSTLVNRLVGGDVQATGPTRRGDHKGRHTTTSRELVPLAGGAVLVDAPGVRMVAMPDAKRGVSRAHDDVEALFTHCRFRDCRHGAEPGCAVRAALESGRLDESRWTSYQKLLKEMAHEACRARDRERRTASRDRRRRRRRRRTAPPATLGDEW
jgi:ribosome biogenesis GTPase